MRRPSESAATRLPFPGIGHRFPWLLRGEGGTFLQKFDGLPIGGAYECHHAVARWPIDEDARFHEAGAHRIDIVDLKGKVAKIACFAVVLRVPVMGELEQRRIAASACARFDQGSVLRGGQEYVGV